MHIWSLRTAASFRNQGDLIHKVGVKLGYAVEHRDLRERANIKKGPVDLVIVLAPVWPRYAFDAVRLSGPWLSKRFMFYGPVDGPFLMNLTFFKILQNMNLTTVSNWCMEQINKSNIICKKFHHHGIDPQDFTFTKREINGRLRPIRKKWPDQTIFFSNINPLHRKGLNQLGTALNIMNKTRAQDYVMILHTAKTKALQLSPGLGKIENLVIEDGYNRLPFRQVALKTRACDCFVFPSLLEGFGLPVLEAAACGRPIICGDFPPLTEIVDHNSAFLFPITGIKEEKWTGPGCTAILHQYDSRDLADQMIYVMDHSEEALEVGEKALEKSKNFHYYDKYEPLVKGL